MRTNLDMSGRYCTECGGTETYIRKPTARPIWHKTVEGLWLCTKCHRKLQKKLKIYQSMEFKLKL